LSGIAMKNEAVLKTLKVVVSMLVWTILIAGVYLLLDYALGEKLRPVDYYMSSGALVSLVVHATRYGWVRGVFRDPRTVQDRKDRAARLAEEHAQIVARVKHE
jgi:hypothetical protein